MTRNNREGFINLVIWISGIFIASFVFTYDVALAKAKGVNHNEEQKRIQSVDMDYSSSVFILSSLMCGFFSWF